MLINMEQRLESGRRGRTQYPSVYQRLWLRTRVLSSGDVRLSVQLHVKAIFQQFDRAMIVER
jgi:hypothetical protein